MAARKLNRIKEVLKLKKLSNKWLAAQTGKNEVTISRWCQNKQQPDLETLYEVARLLEVPIARLLVEEPLEEE